MQKPFLTESKVECLVLPRCAICNNVPEHGIKGGYLIINSFICYECESKILNTEVGSKAYKEFLELIKRIIK